MLEPIAAAVLALAGIAAFMASDAARARERAEEEAEEGLAARGL